MTRTYRVTIRTTYRQSWTHTVPADSREDAIDAAAELCEWDWSHATERNEIEECVEVTEPTNP